MRAFTKDFRHSLWKSRARFLSIAAIVLLGAGIFSGLWATCPDMQQTIDAYYDDSNMMDFRLLSTWGFTDDDIAEISQTDGIAQVYGGYNTDRMIRIEDNDYAVRIHSLPTTDDGSPTMNQLTVLEGRLPEAENECVVLSSRLDGRIAEIGDVITVEAGEDSNEDILAQNTFTVVGIVQAPYYLSETFGTTDQGNGMLDGVLYIPSGAFHSEYYTEAYATVAGATEKNSFSNAYQDHIDGEEEILQQTADVQEQKRFDQTVQEAQAKWEESNVEFQAKKNEAQSQLADAKRQLDDLQKQLDAAQQKLDNGFAQYRAAAEQFTQTKNESQQALSVAKQTLNEQQAQLAQWQAELAASKEELDFWQQQLDLAKENADNLPEWMQQRLEEEQAELSEAMAQWQQKSDQLQYFAQSLQEANTQLAEKEQQLAIAQQQLDTLQQQLTQGQAELSQRRAQFQMLQDAYTEKATEVEEQLAEGQQQLDDAKAQIDQMTGPEWYITDRSQNTGYVSFDSDSHRMASLSTVFPIVFFLVAALVALTSMTRMVDEERGIIGTYKALGYSDRRIASRYLLYAFLATIFGSVIGIALGFWIIPTVVWNSYGIIYQFPPIQLSFHIGIALLSVALSLLCTLGATASTLMKTLKELPASLLRPKAPQAGKRIFLERISPVWKHISFSWKVTARNLLLNKKRFLMTVVGVAGCTALLLTGFGVSDSVNMIPTTQYQELFQYNTTVGIDTNSSSDELMQIMQDTTYFDSSTRVMSEMKSVWDASGENEIDAYLYVPEDIQAIPQFIQFRERKGHKPISFDEDSVIISEKIANNLNLAVGDTIQLQPMPADGSAVSLTVTDITENYTYNYVYLSPSTYWKLYGEAPAYNQYLVNANGSEETNRFVHEQLPNQEGVSYVTMIQDTLGSIEDALGSIDAVVLILIVSAGLLAFVVLYNLTNINVCERIREIATIKVLGFSDHEVNAYIYRETIILTSIGCLIGLLFGNLLFQFVIQTVEVDMVMLGRIIDWKSYLISIALTFVFALLVNLVMNHKMKKIDMIESLKSVE